VAVAAAAALASASSFGVAHGCGSAVSNSIMLLTTSLAHRPIACILTPCCMQHPAANDCQRTRGALVAGTTWISAETRKRTHHASALTRCAKRAARPRHVPPARKLIHNLKCIIAVNRPERPLAISIHPELVTLVAAANHRSATCTHQQTRFVVSSTGRRCCRKGKEVLHQTPAEGLLSLSAGSATSRQHWGKPCGVTHEQHRGKLRRQPH